MGPRAVQAAGGGRAGEHQSKLNLFISNLTTYYNRTIHTITGVLYISSKRQRGWLHIPSVCAFGRAVLGGDVSPRYHAGLREGGDGGTRRRQEQDGRQQIKLWAARLFSSCNNTRNINPSYYSCVPANLASTSMATQTDVLYITRTAQPCLVVSILVKLQKSLCPPPYRASLLQAMFKLGMTTLPFFPPKNVWGPCSTCM